MAFSNETLDALKELKGALKREKRARSARTPGQRRPQPAKTPVQRQYPWLVLAHVER